MQQATSDHEASPSSASAAAAAAAASPLYPLQGKPIRTLACAHCRQRKLKCTQDLPCSNCVRAQVSCVPTIPQVRRPRRSVPERVLQERIQKYEALLRCNNIPFEDEDLTESSGGLRGNHDNASVLSRGSLAPEKPDAYHSSALRRALREVVCDSNAESAQSSDNDDLATSHHPWQGQGESSDGILLGSTKSNISLTTLHPRPVHILRLWQVYLDNVDPLLKITHNATLQTRLIEVAGDTETVTGELEALCFGIYCIAVRSLSHNECWSIFGQAKSELLATYQYGCKQALLSCGYLQSSSRECLTAFFLYLLSLGSSADPRSICTLTGAAIRIAERMRMHREQGNSRASPLEAELRRRLWWALYLFDIRMTGMSGMHDLMTTPSWDCAIPLNVHDADLCPESHSSPLGLKAATEAVFAVTACEQGMFMRCSQSYESRPLARAALLVRSDKIDTMPEYSNLPTFERKMNEQYLQFCNLDIPLQYITVWALRGFFAKRQMFRTLSQPLSDGKLDATTSDAAITMLECDTKIMTSKPVAGFSWYFEYYFPFPAYIAIVKHIKEYPLDSGSERAWAALADNYEARFCRDTNDPIPIRKICDKAILQAWKARDAAFLAGGVTLPPPRVINSLLSGVAYNTDDLQNYDSAQLEQTWNSAWIDIEQDSCLLRGQKNYEAPVGDDPVQQWCQQWVFPGLSQL